MQHQDVVEDVPNAQAALPTRWQEREALARRLGIGVLVLVLVTAAAGVLGPKDASLASATGDVDMVYPRITRPGVDTRVVITVRPEDGARHVLVRIDRSIVESLGVDSFSPEPSSMRSRGDQLELELEADGAQPVVVELAGRVPTRQPAGSRDWEVRRVADGRPSTISTTTWFVP